MHFILLARIVERQGGRPLDQHEPTDIQIHCMHHRLWMQGRTPYADFAVWGPYNDRTRRNNKFRTFVADGLSSYRQIEKHGCNASRRVR